MFKVNPPLRTKADIEALVEGVVDGTIDAIATDHAPHPADAKEQPLDEAPPGMLGLETALGVCLPILASAGMSVADVVAALSWKPAAIAGVADRHGGPIEAGRPANLVVFDPDESWEVRPGQARPAAAATRRTSASSCAAGCATRCSTASPTVIDGVARR